MNGAISIHGILVLGMLTILAPFLIYRGVLELCYYPNETAPTAFTMSNFHKVHGRQRWLTVTGRLATEVSWSSPDQQNLFVPIVDPSAPADGPIEVVVDFNNKTDDVNYRLPPDTRGPVTVTGFMAPSGAWDNQRMFPGRQCVEPVVYLYAGQRPNSSSEGWFEFIAGWLLALLCWWRYWRLCIRLKSWRASRPQPVNPYQFH